jgi:PAS domain S-box-containing protein
MNAPNSAASAPGSDELLLVDDSTESLGMLAEMLTRAGYRVRLANDGALALRSARYRPPSLVLLDVRMPGIDGYEVCRRLKADSATAAVPVIFVTWLNDLDDKVRGFEAGAVDFIGRPYEKAEVLARVATHLALRRRERELDRLSRIHAALGRVNQVFVRAAERDAMLQQVCAALVDTGLFKLAWIAPRDPSAPAITPLALAPAEFSSREELRRCLAAEAADGLVTATLRCGETTVGQDTLADPRLQAWQPLAQAAGLAAVCAQPLQQTGQTWGVLVVHADEANYFGPRELALLSEVAAGVAYALELAQAALEHQARAVALKNSEAELAESNQLLATVLGHTGALTALLDLDFNFIWANPAYAATEPRALTALAGRNHFDLYPHAGSRRLFQQVADSGEPLFIRETPLTRAGPAAQGPTYWDWSVVPVKDEQGRARQLVLTAIDVTERKRVQDALLESEDKFRYVFQNAIIAMSLTRPTGEVEMNQAFCDMLGYTPAEMAGRHWREISHPTDIADTEKVAQALLTGKSDQARFHKRYLHKDGRTIWCDVATSLRWRDGQPLHYLTAARDITKEKQEERKVRRLLHFLDSCLNEIYVFGARDLRFSYANQGALKNLGYSLPELQQLTPLDLKPPLTPEVFRTMVETLVQGETEQLHFESVHRRANGTEYPVEAYVQLTEFEDEKWLLAVVTDISQRRQAAAALQASEARFRCFFESSMDGLMVTVPDGRILAANPAACRILGRPESEIVLAGRQGVADPLDPRLRALLEERARSGRAAGEMTMVRGDGTRFEAEISSAIFETPEGARAGMVIRDNTERRMAVDALRVSEERFRRAVVDAPFPIMLHAEDGEVIQVSNAWCEITGYTRAELPTIAAWTHLAYGARQARVATEIDALYSLPGRKEEGDYTIRTKAGTDRIWQFSSAPLGKLPDGRRTVISMALDVTERRAAEQRVSELNASLEERVKRRTQELQAANQEMEAFSYSVSHDLRAPLRAIDGYARILAQDHADQLPVAGRQLLATVCAEAQRMGCLIDSLLKFARINRQPVQLEKTDMNAVVDTALRWCTSHAAAGLKLQTQIHALPAARCDSNLLQQVWVNLISNALKFSVRRDVIEIEIGGRRDAAECTYFIKDNGAGFDPRYAGKLFGVFQRLHHESDFEGTGIGLALVQRLIARQGGRVWASGEIEKGATFSFTLPSAEVPVAREDSGLQPSVPLHDHVEPPLARARAAQP